MSKPRRGLDQVSCPAPTPAGRATRRAVRIIGGQWRRSILPVLDLEGLRPTPDRVRETVFNWISHFASFERLDVLDLFAGSGALGLEAASRGARTALLIDRNPKVVASLQATAFRLKAANVRCELHDGLSYLGRQAKGPARFDLLFLDPPFHGGWLERLLPLASRVTRSGGLIYVESENALEGTLYEPLGLELLRADKAGQVVYHLLRRNIDAAGPAPKNKEDEAC